MSFVRRSIAKKQEASPPLKTFASQGYWDSHWGVLLAKMR